MTVTQYLVLHFYCSRN